MPPFLFSDSRETFFLCGDFHCNILCLKPAVIMGERQKGKRKGKKDGVLGGSCTHYGMPMRASADVLITALACPDFVCIRLIHTTLCMMQASKIYVCM